MRVRSYPVAGRAAPYSATSRRSVHTADLMQPALQVIVDNAFEIILSFVGLVLGILLQRAGDRFVRPRGRTDRGGVDS
jgi:hypothetical protein